MAFVNLPARLSALRSVSQAVFASVWQALADVVNGQLDSRNFAERARIDNTHKGEPYSVVPVRLAANISGQELNLQIPPGIAAERIVRWTAFFVGTYIGFAQSGKFTGGELRLYRNAGLVDTALLANVATGVVCDRALNVACVPTDILGAVIVAPTYVGGEVMTQVWVDVWLKTKHVR